MEVRNKFRRLRAKLYNLVSYKIWLDTRYTVTIYALYPIQSLEQIDEFLTRSTTKIARIYARNNNLFLATFFTKTESTTDSTK